MQSNKISEYTPHAWTGWSEMPAGWLTLSAFATRRKTDGMFNVEKTTPEHCVDTFRWRCARNSTWNWIWVYTRPFDIRHFLCFIHPLRSIRMEQQAKIAPVFVSSSTGWHLKNTQNLLPTLHVVVWVMVSGKFWIYLYRIWWGRNLRQHIPIKAPCKSPF